VGPFMKKEEQVEPSNDPSSSLLNFFSLFSPHSLIHLHYHH